MRKILLIIQQPTSETGRVGQLLRQSGYILDIRCPSLQDQLPATMDEHEGVVIFGGPMSANDSETLPFIRTELDWIGTALDSHKPFLGICLGAQLLARVLGATVAPHPDGIAEVGYYPVVPTQAGQTHFLTACISITGIAKDLSCLQALSCSPQVRDFLTKLFGTARMLTACSFILRSPAK